VIVYLDSSVLARAYLADEVGHAESAALLDNADADVAMVTGTCTRIEVSGALIRAARSGRIDAKGLLDLLDADLAPDGPVTVLSAPQEEVEETALSLVREHAIRAMAAWHLAVASLTLPQLVESGEELSFASRDTAQAEVAELLGFRRG
jgi:predicted nucleic acid-binding protein